MILVAGPGKEMAGVEWGGSGAQLEPGMVMVVSPVVARTAHWCVGKEAVPFVCTIFGGIRPGRMILIQGSPSCTATRFQVDLQCGGSIHPQADVAFHFNPRFSKAETHVICNTLYLDQWQEEIWCSEVPIRKGVSFLLLFLFLADRVKVSVGGKHLIDFTYRLPLCDVDTLGIYGEVSVKEIAFLCSNPYNPEKTEYPLCEPLKIGSAGLETPFFKSLPEGLSEGHNITVRGLVTEDPYEINLLLKAKDFVPFKLTANFADQTLCYSNLMGSLWAEPQQILTPFFLFYEERFFEILIHSETGVFKLAINGNPLTEFNAPTLDLKSIDEIEINGSAQLYTIQC
ncbi:galectin-12 [Discoglossus pictus]